MAEQIQVLCKANKDGGRVWLSFEAIGGEPTDQCEKLAIDLRPDTTLTEAKMLASQIDRYLTGVTT